MFIKELSCIEALLNHLLNGTSLNSEIFADFSSVKTFNDKKNNLFNYISIMKLIENYRKPAPFSLERFISNGTINGIYDKPTITPSLDPKDQYNPEEFVANLIEAFKEDNYILDEDGSVFVSSEKVEVNLPQAWLYRLAEGYKRKHFSKLFLYNKDEESDIFDRVSLIDYLRHTKTFLVSLDSPTRDDYEIAFAKAEAVTNQSVKKEIPVRVEDLIGIFQSNIPSDYSVKIDRYKLSDLFFIAKRADQAGRDFYTKSLEEQKAYINEWLLDYINCNHRANEVAQEYLLLGDEKDQENSKKDIIVGLINLYCILLKSQAIDFNDVSLTNFKIEAFLTLPIQESLERKKELNQRLRHYKEERIRLRNEIIRCNARLDELSISDADFQQCKSYHAELVEQYRQLEQEEKTCKGEHDTLQNSIREAEKDSLLDISFDNNRIMEMVIEATKHGRVYIAKDNIIFELYNTELGKTSFKTIINAKDFLTLMEDINFTLKEAHKSVKN